MKATLILMALLVAGVRADDFDDYVATAYSGVGGFTRCGNVYVSNYDTIVKSGNAFVSTKETFTKSGNVFVSDGNKSFVKSGNAFVGTTRTITQSGNTYIGDSEFAIKSGNYILKR